MSNTNEIPEYMQRAIIRGYCFECACGELHRTEASALNCRKCLRYLCDGEPRRAIDIRKPAPQAPAPYVQEPWTQPTLGEVWS